MWAEDMLPERGLILLPCHGRSAVAMGGKSVTPRDLLHVWELRAPRMSVVLPVSGGDNRLFYPVLGIPASTLKTGRGGVVWVMAISNRSGLQESCNAREGKRCRITHMTKT